MKTFLFLLAVALVGCQVFAQQTNEFCFLNPQTITYSPVGNKMFPTSPFALKASVDSGLPLTYKVTGGPATITTNGLVTLTGAGQVYISLTQDGCNNYPFCTCAYAAATPVTITFSVSAIAQLQLGNLLQTYDGSPKTPSATTTPQGLTVAFTYNGLLSPPINAGNYLVVATVKDTYYTGSANGTLVVRRALLGVSGLRANDRVYDGTTSATINTANATLAGVAPLDKLSVTLVTSGAVAAFVDKNVGTGKTVSITGLTLSGSAAGNYTLTQPTATASITRLGLAVSGITAIDKVYDGTTSAIINTSIATPNFVLPVDLGNVILVTSGAVGTFADRNVGTGKPVSISGLTLNGSAAGNYLLMQPTATASITGLGLAVSGITAADKVYDGTTSATINTSIATPNFVLPVDLGNVTLVTSSAFGTFADKNVGTAKTVNISGLTLSGSAAYNYLLTQPVATASITPLALTVRGITAANKVYDGTTSATINTSNASLNGVVAGDTSNVTLVTAGAIGTFADSNIGTGKTVTINGLALNGSAAGYYTLIQPTTTADIVGIPALTITSPALIDNQFTVSIGTVPGVNYILEYKDSLANQTWIVAQILPGTGGPITLTDNMATNSTRVYRVHSQ